MLNMCGQGTAHVGANAILEDRACRAATSARATVTHVVIVVTAYVKLSTLRPSVDAQSRTSLADETSVHSRGFYPGAPFFFCLIP